MKDFNLTAYCKTHSIATLASREQFKIEDCNCKISTDSKIKYEEVFKKLKQTALNTKELSTRLIDINLNICPYHYTKYIMN